MHRPARPFAQPSERQPCQHRGRRARVQLNGPIPGETIRHLSCGHGHRAGRGRGSRSGDAQSPSCGAAGTSHADLSRRSLLRRWFGPASVYWLPQEYNGPARSLYDTVAHRTSFVVYRPEFRRTISHSTAGRRLPWADSLRCAEAEIAVFAGFTQAYWSTPQHESHRRQGRRSCPTKINKGSDQQGGAAANMHGDRRGRAETRPPAFLAMP